LQARETIMIFLMSLAQSTFCFVSRAMQCVCLREKRAAGARDEWMDICAAEKASGAANYHTLQTAVTLISLSRLITHSSRPSSLITVIVLLFLLAAPSLSHLWRQVAKFIWRTRRLMRLSPPAPSLAADNAFIRLLARERVIWQGRIAD
jgi:hypothetical protein